MFGWSVDAPAVSMSAVFVSSRHTQLGRPFLEARGPLSFSVCAKPLISLGAMAKAKAADKKGAAAAEQLKAKKDVQKAVKLETRQKQVGTARCADCGGIFSLRSAPASHTPADSGAHPKPVRAGLFFG